MIWSRFLLPWTAGWIVWCVLSCGWSNATMTLFVPGSANPYLAGMPDGTTASGGDSAPGQSPVLVSGLDLSPGSYLTFSATGTASYNGGTYFGPDGGSYFSRGNESGISGIRTSFGPHRCLSGYSASNHIRRAGRFGFRILDGGFPNSFAIAEASLLYRGRQHQYFRSSEVLRPRWSDKVVPWNGRRIAMGEQRRWVHHKHHESFTSNGS